MRYRGTGKQMPKDIMKGILQSKVREYLVMV